MLSFFRKIWNDASDTGARAERLAADWLRQNRRFVAVTQNWRNPRDRRQEIDLVCRDGDALVFVEVKARAAEALVRGFFAVDRRKKRVLLRAAKSYLARLPAKPRTFRFDVVEVVIPLLAPAQTHAAFPDTVAKVQALPPGQRPEVRHYENVPLFGKDFR